jgi:hypothetical protein
MLTKIFRSQLVIGWLIVIYCAVNAWDLVLAWQTAPYERYSWIVLAIWCVPIAYYFLGSAFVGKRNSVNSYLLGAALAFSLLGTLGGLHILHHAGLALALAGLLPWHWEEVVWIICSISWMPAIGWAGSFFSPSALLILRLFLAAVSTWLVILKLHSQSKEGR